MTIEANPAIQPWLHLQCTTLTGVIRAVVLIGAPGSGQYRTLTGWPDGAVATPALANAAGVAIQRDGCVVHPQEAAPAVAKQEGDILACQLAQDSRSQLVVAIEMSARSEALRNQAVQTLTSGLAWLELLMQQRSSASESRLLSVVEIVAASVEHSRFQAAAASIATLLAARLGCERVSLGFVHGRHVQVQVLSRSASMDRRTSLSRAIGAAMEEALDQDVSIGYPHSPHEKTCVTRAHAELAQLYGAGSVCTVPISHDGQLVGAVTFEHTDEKWLDVDAGALCELVVSLVGPILDDKRQRERWFGAKIWQACRNFFTRLVGPRHAVLKLASAGAISIVALLMFATAEFRVTAQASLAGEVQRAVVSPQSGFVAEAKVRAGDIVETGQVLCRLDDKDLTLEKLKWASEQSQLLKEHREAIAQHDSTRVSILQARLERVTAQIALTDARLTRTRITAPLSGIVVKGDLSQSLGAPVERGDTLFEVAPLDAYRVVLEVDERSIGLLRPGQTGRLALVGFPDDYLPFLVGRITPVSTAIDGRNFFTVEAQLQRTPELLRPGMQGIGKIDIGRRKLAWIWSHELTDWLGLWTWSWAPWA